eukprot:Nk52_evm74s212 gene=Nk52_evmTU74s212
MAYLIQGRNDQALRSLRSAHQESNKCSATIAALAKCLLARDQDQGEGKGGGGSAMLMTVFGASGYFEMHPPFDGGVVEDEEDVTREQKVLSFLIENITVGGGSYEVLTLLGILYFRQNRHKEALDCLQRAASMRAFDSQVHCRMGSALQWMGNLEGALKAYRVAASVLVDQDSSAALWNNIGLCFLQKRKYVASLSCLQKSISIDPLNWKIRFNNGLLNMLVGLYASAAQQFKGSIMLYPRFAGSFALLAMTLYALGDSQAAESAFRSALSLSSEDPFILINFALFIHLQRKENQGDFTQHELLALIDKCEKALAKGESVLPTAQPTNPPFSSSSMVQRVFSITNDEIRLKIKEIRGA